MNKISEHKKFNDGSKFLQQIMAIRNNGCNGLKCKNCCLQKLCPHYPSVAKKVANKIIAEAYENAFRDKDVQKKA